MRQTLIPRPALGDNPLAFGEAIESAARRTFRTGKGRTQRRLRFIMPYWVSLDLLDGDVPTTHRVHTVTPRRGAR
jgi:hypothetical protein